MEQTRLYLIRPPSVECTWWKRMSRSSVAEYSFTPMLTRPNDTAPRQIDRMPPLPCNGSDRARGPDRQAEHSKIRRIGAGGCPRQVDRPPVSPGRGTHPRGKRGTRVTDRPGLRSARTGRPSLSPVGASAVLPGERAVLDRVVDELQDVG